MTVTLPSSDKTGWESRRHLYEDVEELLSTGYLSCPVEINGLTLAMRTLLSGDHRMIGARAGFSATSRAWKEWAVASTTWMVDGYVLFGHVNAAVPVRKSLLELPHTALDALFSIFNGLYNRMTEAVRRTEAFCYEPYSRSLWRMSNRGGTPMQLLPGLEASGMNPVQRVWTAFNVAEDERETWQREWAAARLVASAHNPKGVKKIASRDESERKMEDERRQRVIHAMVYRITGRRGDEHDGLIIQRAVTSEELVDEMNRWLHGERDWHDHMIESYKDAIRAKQDEDQAAHAEKMREVEAMAGQAHVTGGVRSGGLTHEELLDFVGSRGLNRSTATVMEGSNAHRIYDKYIAKDITVGGLAGEGKAVAMPSGDMTLDEQVGGRRVVARLDGED